MRAFVAIKLPDTLLQELGRFQDRLARRVAGQAVRWVRPEQMHLTLRFLGEVAEDKIDEMRGFLQQIGKRHRPIRLQTGSLGGFPSLQSPRVVFLALRGELNLLQALAQDVDRELGPYGDHQEQRDFHPHLTLGRISRSYLRQARTIGRALQGVEPPELPAWTAEKVYLIRSQLRPDGPVYTDLCAVELSCQEEI